VRVRGRILGRSDGRYALWLDDELRIGHSSPSLTFHNETLSSTPDFDCVAVELWGLADDIRIPESWWRRPGQPSMAALAASAAADTHRRPGAPLVSADSTATPLLQPSQSMSSPALVGTPLPRAAHSLAAKNR